MGDVQRYSIEGQTANVVMAPYEYGEWVRYADHVRVVAEMEQAHAAALADAVDATEVEAFWRGVMSGERAAASRTLTAGEATDKAVALLQSIGLDITYTDDGLRVIAEQIGRAYLAAAPRTLTADDNYRRGLTDALAAVRAENECNCPNESYGHEARCSLARNLRAIAALIHDSGKEA